jgi:hypothetical protein
MSQGLITVEIIQISLCLLRYDKKCDENIEKLENALLENNFKVACSTCFLLKLSDSNPLQGFYY